VKLSLLVSTPGEPVEMFLAPGSTGEVSALPVFNFDLPPGSTVYSDSAFTLYSLEEVMREAAGINFSPMRKKNSTRPVPAYLAYLQARGAKWCRPPAVSSHVCCPKAFTPLPHRASN
jgi:hypothetical protein